MANYQEWNSGIYDFYFKDSNTIESHSFSVDKNAICKIGKTIGVSQDNAIEDFYNCVINYMRSGESFKIPEPQYSNFETPFQTAILAFFIYIASTMGESKDFGANAYWKKLEIENNLTFPLNNRKNLPELFNNFANKVSNKENIEYSFENYFEHWTNIGFPMTQAMITEKDYCLLTQKFNNIRNEFEIYNWDIENDKCFKDFSLIMQKVVKKEKNQWLSKIISLYGNWDGNVLEIDEVNYKRNRKIINLLYSYSESKNLKPQFYITAEARNDYESIQFREKLLIKDNNYKYYRKIPISTEELSLNNILSYAENYPKLPIQRKKTDFIKLKKENGFFIEQTAVNSVKVGDRFSIIATEEFFEKNYEDLERITQDDLELIKIDGTNLYLLHDIEATGYDKKIVAFNPVDKIIFKNGLKSNTGNNVWIKGAEPIIETKDMSFVKIDGVKEKDKKIDIRYKYNDDKIEHIINLDKSDNTRNYKIIPINRMVETEDFKKIYHIISKSHIEHSPINIYNLPIVIGGFIDNIETLYKHKESISIPFRSKKLLYTLNLLKMHNNTKAYKMPQKMKKTIENIANNCDETTALELYKYIEKNEYIDNYAYIYLKHIGRIAYEQAK